jgi:phosphoglycolate phosphatase-like HAD superfamily hydrolase
VTLGFLWLRSATLEEFVRREISERLMRAHGVVAVLPASELGVEMRDVLVVGDHLIELLVARAMGAFKVTVESGRTGRKHEERQVS